MLLPLVVGISYAFQQVHLLQPDQRNWVGLEQFPARCWPTACSGARCATRCSGPSPRWLLQFLLGLGLALLLNRQFPGRKLVQALVFLPWAVPTFLSGLTWAWLFNPVIGPAAALALRAGPDGRAVQHPRRSRHRHVGADHRQCLVRHPVLRDHAAGRAAVDPVRALRGGRDRRRRAPGSASPRSRCRSSRRRSPSP